MTTRKRPYSTYFGLLDIEQVLHQMRADGVMKAGESSITYDRGAQLMRCVFCNSRALNRTNAVPWIIHHQRGECIADPEFDH